MESEPRLVHRWHDPTGRNHPTEQQDEHSLPPRLQQAVEQLDLSASTGSTRSENTRLFNACSVRPEALAG